MPMRAVTHRQRASVTLEKSHEANGPEVSTKVATDLLAPHLREGEELPDLLLVMTLFNRYQVGLRRGLLGAEKDQHLELGGDIAVRLERDDAVTEGLKLVVNLRRAYRGYFGPQGPSYIGLGESPYPVNPWSLQRQLDTAAERLANPELPDSGLGDDAPDHAKNLVLVRNRGVALANVLDELSLEQHKAGAATYAKNAAIGDFDPGFTHVASIFEAVYHLGGRADLAKRVRPVRRRKKVAKTEETGGQTG